MLRLLISLSIISFGLMAVYFFYLSFTDVKFSFISFHQGILTLRKRGFFSSEEVQFRSELELQTQEPSTMLKRAARVTWYEFPSGYPVQDESPEKRAILRVLRLAYNTGLLRGEDQ